MLFSVNVDAILFRNIMFSVLLYYRINSKYNWYYSIITKKETKRDNNSQDDCLFLSCISAEIHFKHLIKSFISLPVRHLAQKIFNGIKYQLHLIALHKIIRIFLFSTDFILLRQEALTAICEIPNNSDTECIMHIATPIAYAN